MKTCDQNLLVSTDKNCGYKRRKLLGTAEPFGAFSRIHGETPSNYRNGEERVMRSGGGNGFGL